MSPFEIWLSAQSQQLDKIYTRDENEYAQTELWKTAKIIR